MKSERLDFLLGRAQVPSLHRRQIKRQVYEKFEQFADEFLTKPNGFLLIHGIAGVGKSNLAAYWLRNRSDICGHHFKNVIWLTDRNPDVRNVAAVGTDALLLLSQSLPVDLGVDQTDVFGLATEELRSSQRYQTMRILLSKALDQSPRTLIVIDDVMLKETIDLFVNLKCSIVAISTRTDIFDHVDHCRRFPLSMDDVIAEDVIALCRAYGIDSVGEHSAHEILRNTGGNFALMEKLLFCSQGNTESLQLLMEQLHTSPLDVVKTVSYYQYASLHTCCSLMEKMVDCRLRENLPSLALLEPSFWLDMEIAALVWPVDVADAGASGITRLVSIDMHALSRSSLVGHQAAQAPKPAQLRVDPLFHFYLISASNPKDLLRLLAHFKTGLQHEKSFGERAERAFSEYLLDHSKDLHSLETLLQRIEKRRKGAAGEKSRGSWLPAWFTSFSWS